MNVAVHAFGPLREVIGEKRHHCTFESEPTVEDLLDRLCSEFDGARAILGDRNEGDDPSVIVTINKQSANTLEGDESVLTDGDIVRISPPIHGG